MVELLNVNFVNSRSHLLGVCFEATKAVLHLVLKYFR